MQSAELLSMFEMCRNIFHVYDHVLVHLVVAWRPRLGARAS